MRVSTLSSFLQGVRSMQSLQSQLSRTQEQVSTGRRILRPSDDPIAAGRSVGFRDTLSQLEQFQRNGDAAESRLVFEEAALNTVNNVLQRVRELPARQQRDRNQGLPGADCRRTTRANRRPRADCESKGR